MFPEKKPVETQQRASLFAFSIRDFSGLFISGNESRKFMQNSHAVNTKRYQSDIS
jgi:hypothetical protein